MSRKLIPPFTLEAKPWLWSAVKGSWVFLTIPSSLSEEVKNLFSDRTRPFGSLPVQVTIGKTIWNTSVFWSTKTNEYVLPLKAGVRKKENIRVGVLVSVKIEVLY